MKYALRCLPVVLCFVGAIVSIIVHQNDISVRFLAAGTLMFIVIEAANVL
jgi:hypothetical protein